MSIDYAAEFARFGADIDRRWRQSSFHPAEFPAVAAEALAQIPALDFDELLLQESSRLNQGYRFSDYDLYIFQNDRFRIEILYWVSASTSIHQHAFSGAFKLATGRSFHVEYDFAVRHEVTPEFLVGDLRLRTSEILEPGAVRKIPAGPAFIHANFHMVRPTVTIVIRTVGEWAHGAQLSYQYPHVATHPFGNQTRRTRQQRLIELVARTGNWELLERAIESLWPDPTLEESLDILELGAIANHPARLASALARVQARHPAFASDIEAVVREDARRQRAEGIRRRLQATDQKFLMTLLINLPDHDAILRHLASEFPGESPGSAAARLLCAIGAEGHLPRVAQAALPALIELIEGRRSGVDALGLGALLAEDVTQYLFPPDVRGGPGERRPAPEWKARPFACRLDGSLLPLLPPESAFRPTAGALASLIANPVRCLQKTDELPPELATRVLVDESSRKAERSRASLDLPTGLAPLGDSFRLWVAHPVTGIMQPCEVPPSFEPQLAALAAGQAVATTLPADRVTELVAAQVLIPAPHDDAERRERQQLADMRRHLIDEQYLVLPGILAPLQVAAMRRHLGSLVDAGQVDTDREQVVDKREGVYNEFSCLYFQHQLALFLNRFVPKPLKPAYTWFYRYEPGAVLHRHRDRPQCRWNVSLAIDAEPDLGQEQAWPLCLQVGDRVRTVKLGLGDAVLYSGTDVPHWRDPLPEGRTVGLCLFHYVDADFAGELR